MLTMTKYGQLSIKRNQVRNCLAQVEDDWQIINSINSIMVWWLIRLEGRRLLIICAIYSYTPLECSFGQLYHYPPERSLNRILWSDICPTYFVLFDVQLRPAYEIIFLMQFFSGFVKCTVTAVCGLANLFVMHTCTAGHDSDE